MMVNQVPREDIQKILEAGVQAPSGSNSQPWRFRVHNGEIETIALPERDHPVLNFRYRGTWVAHGAMIENMAIATRTMRYEAHVKLFPNREDHNVTSRLRFERIPSPQEEELYRAISGRATNRKPYDIFPLASQDIKALQDIAHTISFPNVEVRFIEDQEKIKELGKAASVNEIIMFENESLHKLLFEEIIWTPEEEQRRGRGLLFKTMELKPPAGVVKLLGKWPFMRFLNMFGVARAIAKDNVKMYASTPLVCAILAGDEDVDFINTGRLMERIWLRATAMGLSSHLMTGVLFLWQRIVTGETELFSKEHIALVQDAYQKTASIVGAGDKNVALLFRIGRGGEPSARSVKLPPIVMYN